MRNYKLAITSIALAFLFVASSVCYSQSSTPDQDMTRGDRQFAAGNFQDAYQSYSRVLQAVPNNTTALYNAGQCAYLLNDPSAALTDWGKLEKISGNRDLRLKEKIIQALESLERTEDVDARVTQLMRLRNMTTDVNYREKPSFCRDQFAVAGQPYLAHQHFGFPTATDSVFSIYQVGEDGSATGCFQLARSQQTNTSAIAGGQVAGGDREFTISEIRNDGSSEILNKTQVELTYNQFKREVVAVLQERADRRRRASNR